MAGPSGPAFIFNFYPRSPCGERPQIPPSVTPAANFYPRSPCGERRESQQPSARPTKDFYPRSPCGERRNARPETRRHDAISIHALLAESDTAFCMDCQKSTYFYPRSPCGERRDVIAVMTAAQSISIHALLAESDTLPTNQHQACLHFYPRSPCGERRLFDFFSVKNTIISIHALLAESDNMLQSLEIGFTTFLSTLSLRRATSQNKLKEGMKIFLSTLSLRRATNPCIAAIQLTSISIHALLAESDSSIYKSTILHDIFLSTLSLRRATLNTNTIYAGIIHFYPRSPCGERRHMGPGFTVNPVISIHALLAESDNRNGNSVKYLTRFLSTLSLRRATIGTATALNTSRDFYPRSPCGERRQPFHTI